jgi:aminomethyltransferase
VVDRQLRRTALYDEHKRLGAHLVPFAGFEMPVHYGSILREHDAVRRRAGLFDLSHMAQFDLSGAGVAPWLDTLTINHVATMKPWQARYNIFCNDRGGAHDDVILYRLDGDDWLLVVNAANAAKMWELIDEQRPAGVQIDNRHGSRALIAVQGPRSVEIVTALAPAEERDAIAAMKYYTARRASIAGVPVLAARTGYTGEDGFELFVEGAAAPELWRALLAEGAGAGLEPAGLGARDMLRLEAGMPLYGFELSEELSPLAAGIKWALKFEKPAFAGREALLAQSERDDFSRIAGVRLDGRVPARHGYPVFAGGRRVGEIASASIAPSLGGACIATALVTKDASAVGTALGVEIRGTLHDARVVQLPFYKRASN